MLEILETFVKFLVKEFYRVASSIRKQRNVLHLCRLVDVIFYYYTHSSTKNIARRTVSFQAFHWLVTTCLSMIGL
jgi:hypothetical protein